MNAVREKDSSDFDLETFVDLFDTALTSDNPAVKKAFKNLLMITAIVHAKQDEFDTRRGPLRRLVDDISNLNRRLNDLENQRVSSGGGYVPPMSPVPMPSYPVGPTWIGPNTGNTPWPGNTTITCGTNITASDTMSLTAGAVEIENLLTKLEAK